MTSDYGGNGGSGGYGDWGEGTPGKVSTQIGTAYGGNKVNITGMKGFDSTTTDTSHRCWGGWYQSDLPYINRYFVPTANLPLYCAGGGPQGSSGSAGKSCYSWSGLIVVLSGGGGGGSGMATGRTSSTPYPSYPGGTGQPGVCIIEKAV